VIVLQAGRSGVSFPVSARNSFFLQNFQTVSGVHLASYSRVLGFLGGEWPGHEVKHSPPPSMVVKNECSCISTPHICLHGMDRESVTLFTFYDVSRKCFTIHFWIVLDEGVEVHKHILHV